MGKTLDATQLGSGNSDLFDSDVINILKDPGFATYAGNKGLDFNSMTPGALKAAANDYIKLGNKINGFGNKWSFDGVLNGLGGYIGTDGQTLKDIGSGLGDVAGFGNTLFGMYNTNKATKMAEDAYNTQKQLTLDKWNTAKANRAEYDKNRQAAINKYYGKA